ncbi:hypothetical protein [Xanthomonas fragariae]|uniref:hypothetical protein n=1 Tax=Xanthomonas fragariae TaxID=48664 RepID=UPI000D54E500|nr:hypothetical protein [Xanthomonas fragariae]MDM7556355.1 hypothetical protein [Xanthomonas fragariae]MDM7559450.1 hypothetical protein [Xanthomonas fragariae]MDM7577134.1 hypothetical protein [Xanthomonas fragariae]MDM7580227.1 hypothetical protein [Xanthomonas fragariae]MDM7590423.1 hypothetical protein [Xanthomonas fragariae]
MKISETSCVKFSVGRLAAGLVLIASIAVAGFATAAERNLGARPAGVPADYVITPFGYFSPSCVQQIHDGDHITQDGGIQRVTGWLEQRKICNQDNFTRDGVRVKPDGRTLQGNLARSSERNSLAQNHKVSPPTISQSWLAFGSYITSSQIGRIVASWQVPPNPRVRSKQTIYYFPGMQGETILQPVLGYRAESNTWDLSSWNCCEDGTVWTSDYIPAKSGDQIVGDTYSTCAPGVACNRWNIDTKNITSGRSVRLTSVPYGDPSLIVGGALEVYAVSSCNELPDGGMLTFSNIAVYDQNMGRVTSPPWEQHGPDHSGLTPQCNYDVHTTDTSVTVLY